jgi:FkbM family methyltransferase
MIIKRGINYLKRLYRHHFDVNSMQIDAWWKDKGDLTHRVDYPLTGDSVVFDVGGYKGEWAHLIYEKYKCHIKIFEPHPGHYKIIKERFGADPKIEIFNFGLGAVTRNISLTDSSDGSSIVNNNNSSTIEIKIVSINDFLKTHQLNKVDLIKINIEGAEYELLEHILESGIVKSFVNIQVQFHNFFPDAYKRMMAIKKRLKATHYITYAYRFVWENWKLR